MTRTAHAVLVNPPLWNAYAPHLAVPLLVGTARARGIQAHGYDLSIESIDHLLSAPTLAELAEVAGRQQPASLEEEWTRQRALLVSPNAIERIEEAKGVLRSLAALHDPERQRQARTVVRDALWVISAAFPGCHFDLVSNTMAYSAESTSEVLAATTDPARNPYRWTFDRMLDWSRFDAPELRVVGVSMSADTQLIAALTFLRMLAERRPDVHRVVGGNFATRMVDRWQAHHPFFDLVDTFLVGEGEESLPSLIEALDAHEPDDRASGPRPDDPRTGVPGAVWSDGDVLRRTPPKPADVRTAATPAFEDLPLDKYLAPGPVLPVYASRSCAWDCAFCSIPFASNSFRQRPAEHVVEEVAELKRRHGTRHFMFVDEIMSIRTLHTVSDALVAAGTDIHWYGETRFAGGLTQELARKLYASGCRRMNFGLESTSQRVLDLMRKGTSTDHIVANINAMLEASVPIHLFVIHGFPGETREEAEDTVAFAEDVVLASRDHYNVPYSTWGGSPFVLDVHSPVGTAPERFGVTVLPPPDGHDLALARNYRSADGLSPGESRRLARQAAGQAVAAATVWFRAERDATAREVEEFTFLRAGTGAPPPRAAPVEALHWPPPGQADRVRVPADIAERRVPWGATAAHAAASLALYHPRLGRFLQLNWPAGGGLRDLDGLRWAEVLDFCLTGGCTYADTAPERTAWLLLRHGFLTVERLPAAAAAERRPAAPRAPGRWLAEPGVTAARHGHKLVLTNPITDVSVRLNESAAALWRRIGESAGAGRGGTPAEADPAHAALARLGFVVLEPATAPGG